MASFTRKLFMNFSVYRRLSAVRISKTIKKGAYAVGTSAAVVQNAVSASHEEHDVKLSHLYLIKNASVACIDSASALLTQTVTNLLEIEYNYSEALDQLTQLLTLSIEHLDSEYRQALYWDAIIERRNTASRLKAERQDMESMFHAAERMLHAAAEAALVGGAEYASTAAGERVFSAQSRLRAVQERRAEAELRAARVEARYVHETSEHHRKKAQQKQQPEGSLGTEQDLEKMGDGADVTESTAAEPVDQRNAESTEYSGLSDKQWQVTSDSAWIQSLAEQESVQGTPLDEAELSQFQQNETFADETDINDK